MKRYLLPSIILLTAFSCSTKRSDEAIRQELLSIDIKRGEIALCGSGDGKFGKVGFEMSCTENVRADFNLATALLHSFEYAESEKVFARVIDADPQCLMAYWGVAMSNFHPLWAPPTPEELEKGSKTVALARTIESKSQKESAYLEAVAAIFDGWDSLNHATRLGKFEQASEQIYKANPDDKEAAIFYALALRAAADPGDKTFVKQRKAGDILNAMFPNEPDHPGIAHYLIHTYDYPELANLALPAARKYASIAEGSAHALHMPSHIFTRLGLWDESIRSNSDMIAAAQCYAESSGINGHWDEELHGIDYLVYAYLQQDNIIAAKQQLDYLKTIEEVFPINNKEAYTFAATPTRYALERKDWKQASSLTLQPPGFPWNNFPWERSLVSFGRVLGAMHLGDINAAKADLEVLKKNHAQLLEMKRGYEATQVEIQVKSAQAWILFAEGNKREAIDLMTTAADLEDGTEKAPVTPGEVVPARELLADMYMEMKDFKNALTAYRANLERHAGRRNALKSAGIAARKAGDPDEAKRYEQALADITKSAGQPR